ncbi:hypothetical protein N8603_03065 [Verrucomicrobiales bacterium]|nr:hypothetical protein [Verrucomicrobiales bacterium]
MQELNLYPEEKEFQKYKDNLKDSKEYLSKFHWHIHVIIRQGYNEDVTFADRGVNGSLRRKKVTELFIQRLRAKLNLKGDQLLYAYLHEYRSGGHIHLLLQFRKYLKRKQKIYNVLKKLMYEYERKYFLLIHYNKQNTHYIWVQDQEKLVDYVCKVEDGLDKQLEPSKYLDKYGLDFDIYANNKDADYDIPLLPVISDKVEKQNKKL